MGCYNEEAEVKLQVDMERFKVDRDCTRISDLTSGER